MKYLLIFIIFNTILINSLFSQDNEISLLYGKKHALVINTPAGWYKDTVFAKSVGLTNIFFPYKTNNITTYMYVHGVDKDSATESLENFIAADIESFNEKYPQLTYAVINTTHEGSILDSKYLSFENMSDRYREEVLYLEMEWSFILFVFSSDNIDDYNTYYPSFEEFIKSMEYLGSDPKEILEFINK